MTVVIRCYNRPDLLALTLWSVSHSHIPAGTEVWAVHDGPPDWETHLVLEQAQHIFHAAGIEFYVEQSPAHLGLHGHAKWTAEHIELEGPFLANLTDDCVVSPAWLLVLEHLADAARGPEHVGVLSGSRAPWMDEHRDQAGAPSHTERCGHASVLGLINAGLWRDTLRMFEPGLTVDDRGEPAAFDGELWKRAAELGLLVLVTQRSLIQHVGLQGVHGRDNPPVLDFVGT